MLGKRFRRTTSMSQLGTGHAAEAGSPTNSPVENQNPPLVATFDLQDVLHSESPVFPINHEVASPTGSRKSTPPVVRQFNVQEQQFGLPVSQDSGTRNVHPEDADRSTHPVNVGMLPNLSNIICSERLLVSKQNVRMCLETEGLNQDCILAPLSLPPPVTQSALSPHSATENLRSRGPYYANHHHVRKEDMHQSPVSSFLAAPPKESPMGELQHHAGAFYPSPRCTANGRMEVAAAIPPVNFLYACFLCKRRLGNGRDIFMYRGDRAFCSDECRQHQIVIDERKEKCSFTAAKQASTTPAHSQNHNTNGKAVPAETAAAA